MARKATEQVTRIGIDIDKNTFHVWTASMPRGTWLFVESCRAARCWCGLPR
jgi:hypothetical protein